MRYCQIAIISGSIICKKNYAKSDHELTNRDNTTGGQHTKCILLGSTNQIDNRNMTKENNDFINSYEKLKQFPFVGYVELFKSERSDICSLIDEALSE